MQSPKFKTGAFVFWRARGLGPQDPKDLKPLAAKHSIDQGFIPDYAGDRTAFVRATQEAAKGLGRKGFLLRPIKRTQGELLFGIVREEKDAEEERLAHDFEATVSWKAEPDPRTVYGDHPVARRVAKAYDALQGKIVAHDWSNAITANLLHHDAAPVRGDGRIYWAPPQRIEDIKKFSAFLFEIGIDLVLCEIEPESKVVAANVAKESIDDDLKRLEEEVEFFDGTQKPSTYLRRLEEYQRLKNRAVLYKDALGFGVDRAQAVLQELEAKVQAMLDIRKQTVIHRNQEDPRKTEERSAA